jgi:hypothetical protein
MKHRAVQFSSEFRDTGGVVGRPVGAR